MIKEIIQSDEMIPPEYQMTPEEYRDFQAEYDQWCAEVALNRIQILDNKESRSE